MHLIFDFDGTLANSFHNVIDKFNFLARKHKFREISENDVDMLRDLSSAKLIKYLQIPLYQIPHVIFEARKSMRSEIKNLPSFENLPQTMQKLHERGFSFGILTSNSIENVSNWLEYQKMSHYFEFIHSESTFFGKTRILKKLLKSYKLDKNQVYYVGDETRDIDAAKQCGIHTIGVTWGFNSEKALSEHHPNHIARKPEDLLQIFSL